MDRYRRRQISANLFLRDEELFAVVGCRRTHSVPFGASQRGKCNRFENGDIHSSKIGNLFLLFHRNGQFSAKFVITPPPGRRFLLERPAGRQELRGRGQQRQLPKKSIDSPVDILVERRRPNLVADYLHGIGCVSVRQRMALHPFHWFHSRPRSFPLDFLFSIKSLRIIRSTFSLTQRFLFQYSKRITRLSKVTPSSHFRFHPSRQSTRTPLLHYCICEPLLHSFSLILLINIYMNYTIFRK